ncbi:MAG TPA: hypothetical protein VMU30_03830, partial [Bacteroidota bacterium]|nr:hypothetical protein [Bacteroidota bacterium]
MKVSATTMKNLIGVKPAEEAGIVTGASTTASTPALFLLMLLQQCNASKQTTMSAVNPPSEPVETLEPTMSFFGELAAVQSDGANVKTHSSQQNSKTAPTTVQSEYHPLSLTSTATATEGIASLVRTVQNTNTTIGASNLKQVAAPTDTTSLATESAVPTGTEKNIAPILNLLSQETPTNETLATAAT